MRIKSRDETRSWELGELGVRFGKAIWEVSYGEEWATN